MTTVEELTSFLATPLTAEFMEWLRERELEQPPGLAWHPRAFEFNPHQLRWPEGHRLGGRWAPSLGAVKQSENERGVRINKQTAMLILESGLDQTRTPRGETARKLLTDSGGKLHEDTQSMHSHLEERPVFESDYDSYTIKLVGVKEQRFYDKKRAKQHARWINRDFLGHQSRGSGDPPEALFMAGGSATGKSSSEALLKSSGLWAPQDEVKIDPDAIKERIPEFQELAAARDPFAAGAVHEESSDVAKKLLEKATAKRRHLVIDGTGDGGKAKPNQPSKFLQKIIDQKKAGYKTRIVMTDAPVEAAIERAIERALGPKGKGRSISIPAIRAIHKSVAERHKEWRDSPYVDEWVLYSTDVRKGEPPILVASGGGGSYSVANETLYAATLAKADADLTAPLVAGERVG